ncbi:MAG: hypothetical protein K9L62_00225 [Vallitaleaceae bacterium]|nr:hypothetical protein [Vallitaleaceae bacterium]
MAKFYRAENGISWLKITWLELAEYSSNMTPICDECLKDLIGYNDIVLIPLLNQAYCHECGKKVLKRMVNYPEDRPYAKSKELFWLDYFGLDDNTAEGG